MIRYDYYYDPQKDQFYKVDETLKTISKTNRAVVNRSGEGYIEMANCLREFQAMNYWLK